ncbi:MAG: hypothetical protein QXO22_04285 [Thermosphaera sp.]
MSKPVERRRRAASDYLLRSRPGSRLLILSKLPFPILYSIFCDLIVSMPDALRDFKNILDSISIRKLSTPLVLDDKALLAEDPEKLVNDLGREVVKHLKKNGGSVTTEAALGHEASRIVGEMLSEAIRVLLAEYGYF